MKKALIYLLTTIILAFCITSSAGCNNINSDLNINNISYCEYDRFVGQTDNVLVSVSRGIREDNFIADGKVNNVNSFCEIKLTPIRITDVSHYFYFDGNNKIELIKALNSLDWVAQINYNDNLDTVTIFCEETPINVSLYKLGSQNVNWQKALKTALSNLPTDNNSDYEIIIKYLSDDVGGESFYYCAVVDTDKNYRAVLIDLKSGKIVAVR